MKKLFCLPLLVAFFACRAQSPTIVSQPIYVLKWVKVGDSVRASIYLQNPNDTLATRAYARGFAGGSIGHGYGIAVSGSTVSIDSANYRKADSLYPVTDSTFILKINGRSYTYKMRGAVFSFNGRIGAVVPNKYDYTPYYPRIDSIYSDPAWITSLNWLKIINLPTTLQTFGITNGVTNGGGAYQWIADLEANRPASPVNGTFFLGIDDSTVHYWNGTRYITVAGGGLDSPVIYSYGLLKTVAGGNITVKVDTTTLKTVFGSGSPGVVQIFTKYGLLINGTDTASVDTSIFLRYSDTTRNIASKNYVLTRGFLTTETDPIATAKTATMTGTAGRGIVISGGTQTIGSNPAWIFVSDTSYLATLFALKDSAAQLRAAIGAGPGITQIYNKYGTIIAGGDSITVDTTKFTRFSDTTATLATKNFVTSRGYLTTETDPVATAKTVSVNQVSGAGVLVTGLSSQALSGNPSWTIKADTALLATESWVLRQNYLSSLLSLTPGYGISGSAYNGTIARTWVIDSSKYSTLLGLQDTAAALRTIISAGGQTLTLGPGLLGGSYNGGAPVTAKADTALLATISYVGRQGFRTAAAVDTIYRTPGTAAIFFTINGRTHSILDSVGLGVVTRIGPIDSLARVANALQISGQTLLAQTADHTHSGMESAQDKLNLDSLYLGLIKDTSKIGYAGVGTHVLWPNAAGDSLYGTTLSPLYGVTIAKASDSTTNIGIDTAKIITISYFNAHANQGPGTTNLTLVHYPYGDTINSSTGTGVLVDTVSIPHPGLLSTYQYSRITHTLVFGHNPGPGDSTVYSNVVGLQDSVFHKNIQALTGLKDSVTQTTVALRLDTTYTDGRYESLAAAALLAPLASPTFTGTPAVPTASPGTNTTQAASTAFVTAAVAAATTGVSTFNGRSGTVVPLANDYTFAQLASKPTTLAGYGITTAVATFNGRTGTVVPVSGDYTFSQISSTPTTVAGYGITDAVTLTGTQTLTNKSINANQLTGTMQAAQFPATTGPVVFSAGSLVSSISNASITNAMLAGSIDLTAKVTGILPVANGGTGVATGSGYAFGNGTSAFTFSTTIPGTAISGNIAGNAASITGAISESQVTNLSTDLAARAPIASPTFTGIPAAPTAAAGTTTTQVATTQFVQNATGGINLNSGQQIVIGLNTSGTVSNGISSVTFNDFISKSTYTLTLPSSPVDGQFIWIFSNPNISIGSTEITTFSIVPNTSQSIYMRNAPTTLVGGDVYFFRWSAPLSTWLGAKY